MRGSDDSDEVEPTLPLQRPPTSSSRLTLRAGSPDPAPTHAMTDVSARVEVPRDAKLPAIAGVEVHGFEQLSGIEVCVIHDVVRATEKPRPWRAVEIWTKRRVYGLDAHLTCIEVLSRETGQPEPRHTMLGARLSGGRRREAGTQKFSFPLPVPGMEAAFSRGKKHGFTSPVERIIVRIRMLSTSSDLMAEDGPASEFRPR